MYLSVGNRVSKEVAQNGHGVERAARRLGEFLHRLAARGRGLCAVGFLTVSIIALMLGASAAAEDKTTASKEVVYRPGGDVKSPKLIHYVEPAFSSSSKEAFVEGVVRISTVVKLDGVPADVQILKGLNSEEDRKAMDAVAKWRFQPGTKNGQPVNVRVTVEVEFHLL